MAWLGASLVLVTSLRYMLFAPGSGAYTELFAVSAEAPPPTMVLAIPAASAALLLMVLSSALSHSVVTHCAGRLTVVNKPSSLKALSTIPSPCTHHLHKKACLMRVGDITHQSARRSMRARFARPCRRHQASRGAYIKIEPGMECPCLLSRYNVP